MARATARRPAIEHLDWDAARREPPGDTETDDAGTDDGDAWSTGIGSNSAA
jgi:hypothetical protein